MSMRNLGKRGSRATRRELQEGLLRALASSGVSLPMSASSSSSAPLQPLAPRRRAAPAQAPSGDDARERKRKRLDCADMDGVPVCGADASPASAEDEALAALEAETEAQRLLLPGPGGAVFDEMSEWAKELAESARAEAVRAAWKPTAAAAAPESPSRAAKALPQRRSSPRS
jgi:hypothetical protein